ncbi:DNA double-strand break repair nuclease NurA [Bradyrhizobium barranii]
MELEAGLTWQFGIEGPVELGERTAGEALLRKYDLSDTQILDVVLGPGEYLEPKVVRRQEPSNKWPQAWEESLKAYPNPLTTYLKPSETVRPFRVETFEDPEGYAEAMTLILATARLLPGYGFPVALDIVDKYAKVPSWLSKEIGTGHKAVLLRKAFEQDDRRLQEYAIKMLSVSSRDWFFRPKA